MARSLRGDPTAAAHVVSHECLQMTDRRINTASRSTVSSIFLFLVILTFTMHYESCLLQ